MTEQSEYIDEDVADAIIADIEDDGDFVDVTDGFPTDGDDGGNQDD